MVWTWKRFKIKSLRRSFGFSKITKKHRVFNLSKDIVFEGSFVCGNNTIYEDGREQWSKWIHGGLKDVTPIGQWAKIAQFNLARSLK